MYSAKIDGEPTTFGTSGFLYRSNKLMYDRKTESLWSSLAGVPVIGDLARRDDLRLSYFPVSLTTWAEWIEERPDTKVLSNDTGYYSPNWYRSEPDRRSVYHSYRADPDTMFPVWERDARLAPKDEVLGVEIGGAAKAYPASALRELRVVNDAAGGVDIVILSSALSSDARVYERGGRAFALLAGDDSPAVPRVLADADGAEWDVRADSIRKRGGGETLARVPSLIHFWFGWRAFHPDAPLFGFSDE